MVYSTHSHSDSILHIDLDAVVRNYQLLLAKMKGKECGAVVKADAYGLGVKPVALALKKAGCERFFVATLDEGIELRQILSEAFIYVFNGISRSQEAYFIEHHLIPVLNSPEQVLRWEMQAKNMDERLPAILHIDTGMNRLGVDLFEAENIMQGDACEVIDFEYIMSHLACSDMPHHPLNNVQLKLLNQARRLFPGSGVSFANSSGLFLDERYCFDLSRPGCALYGINPTPGKMNPMQHVVRLTSQIIQTRVIDRVTTVGYGATCDLAKGSVVATVPVGYADGFLRSQGNIGKVVIAGQKMPIVGRVSMDLITVDISNLAEQFRSEGTEVEVMGEHMPVDIVAKAADTNGYEVLTRLGKRFMREYKGGVEGGTSQKG